MKINEMIHINQIGYRPQDKKVFIVNGKDGAFEVVDVVNNEVVFAGQVSGPVSDPSSGDEVYYGDFSSVTKAGEYYISMPGFGRSYSFAVKEHVYKDVKNGLLKAFYFQRCGTALEEKHAGPWKHGACHTKEGIIYGQEDKRLDGTGGWHDAGDYGRYVVPAAKALADLLLAYEFFPDAFAEEINIPESGNGVPDILNECRYELEWLFKMQDQESGGVYHKLTTKHFCGMVMPEEDAADLYFLPISSTATGTFAAVMAMAARIYKPFDGGFAARCLSAAEKAWGWLRRNPDFIGYQNPPDVWTGGYGDRTDRDERFWAAAELYRTTGEEQYHESFKESYGENFDKYELGWAPVGGYGTIAYLFTPEERTDGEIRRELLSGFLKRAEELVVRSQEDGYGISLGYNEYRWGSNMNVCNNAMHLILAHMLRPNDEYIQAAQAHLHYILGRNALDQCYVTGFGSKPVMAPHHRPSEADGIVDPVPGLLSGGPNSGLQDRDARRHLQGQPPSRCFIDVMGSFSTNEITIYWNSPAVFVAGYFDQA